MGKKSKIGKARKDKFYKLAKETGLRSRAAFKLLQLNRKYEFLQKSRVCIDLCAAPGGWLQVAVQNMPVSSLIVGVDLVSIKPIHNVTTIQEDITTAKCRQALKKELQTWQADVVLNDGAPNVGQNWLHDAFQQAQLTLSALKLATTFLRKGGWFITKVFRSKDYQALIWVFKQLFRHVHATKPQASRNVSAEIFVVCQGFLSPTTLDPKFLDPKHVFKDVAEETKPAALRLRKPEKDKKKAEGYDEGATHLHVSLKLSEFISSNDYLELLANCHEIILDNPDVESHKATTRDIIEACRDVKVLGKKEIRNLLNWRKKLQKDLFQKEKEEDNSESKSVTETHSDKDDDNDDDEREVDEQIARLKATQQSELKRKKKKVMKEKRKLRDKMALGMVIPGDHIEQSEDINIFDLKKIETRKHLIDVGKGDMEVAAESLGMEDHESDDEDPSLQKKKVKAYDRFEKTHLDEDGRYISENQESDVDDGTSSSDDDMEDADAPLNPLVVDMETKAEQTKRQTELWFQKDSFAGLEEDEDEDLEITQLTEDYKRRGGHIREKDIPNKKRKLGDSDSGHASDSSSQEEENMSENVSEAESEQSKEEDTKQDDSQSDSDDSDSDDSDSHFKTNAERKLLEKRKQKNTPSKSSAGFEVVPATESGVVHKLDPVELAIGEELIKSSKRRRELIEMSYNRYTTGEEDLPSWFVVDESKHNKARPPVTKEQVQEYKDKMKAINLRPIGKIAEAKARKKKKMVRKLEKARKKAETVTEEDQTTDNEKWKQIKDIYKKAGLLKKKKESLTYVVAKKGAGKRVSRPVGVKGKFKVVDPRMKKDLRKVKAQQKQSKGRKGKSNRPGRRK